MRALLAGTLLLVAACTSTAAPEPAVPVASGSWSVELSTAPTLMAVGPTDVYVASFGNGVGGSQVYRVDRESGVLEEQRTLAGQPNGMVLAADGRLWVATLRLPGQQAGTGLQVLDGETLQTQRAVAVDDVPMSLAFVGEDLWVGGASGARRYDAAADAVSLQPAVTAPSPGRAGVGVTVTAEALWVADPGAQELRCADAMTGAVRSTEPVPRATGSLAADAEQVFVGLRGGLAAVPATC